MRRKPALLDKAFNCLLLAKIQGEERVSNLTELTWLAAVLEVPPESLQLEEAICGKRHNEGRGDGGSVESESTVFSLLSFYCVSEIPNVLAIVRYHAYDDHDRTLAVAEDIIYDTPDEFCRIEQQVEDALINGMDVSIMSNHQPDYFPVINSYITDVKE